ncbi:MAG: heme A synthase [Gammaproteobacteria bacterium]|nr:heme A synthase [Gammaproteobacteria bacterium]
MQGYSNQQHSIVLGIWLMACAATVYIMIVVGGITRLTQSGLSMVEWAPIMGVIPPLSEAAWLEVFAKYQASPEYLKVNLGMSLEDFKGIFWWEYGHRLLGRFIGLVYFLPLLFFLLKGMVPKSWVPRLFGLFLLGGLQGLMGWYMVKSGLVDVPHVSQYRLTAHLGLALIIFACMFWFALDFLRGDVPHNAATPAYLTLSKVVVAVVLLMMLSGGFVAGTKAGFIMNTFPTMNGQWVPAGWLAQTPWWRNFFENAVTIQFIHRCIAVLVVIAVLLLYHQSRRQPFATRAGWLLSVTGVQIALGISALLLMVPVALGAAHQAGAVAVLATALWVAHCARKVPQPNDKLPA